MGGARYGTWIGGDHADRSSGAIGVVELIHFTGARRFGAAVFSLFGIVVDAMWPLPCIPCGARLADRGRGRL